MFKHFILSTLILCTSFFYAQVGIGTVTPAEGAILDVHSENSGIYIPRVNLVAANSQEPILSDVLPEPGLLVYNKATAGTYPNDVTPGFYWWYGGGWVKLGIPAFTTDSSGITSNRPGSIVSGHSFVFGSYSLDYVAGGYNSRLFFDKYRGAFRAGWAQGTQWDSSNLGDFSSAFGFSTLATGEASTAMGSGTWADGNYSFAMGIDSQATGFNSTVIGWNSIASGYSSVAMGYYSFADGGVATALGSSSAYGDLSTAMGFSSTVGPYSTAMGASGTSGAYSTAMGNSYAGGAYSTAMGDDSEANGDHSTAIGSHAVTNHNGSFVYSDLSSYDSFVSTAQNQFSVRAAGGYRLFTNPAATSGVVLAAGGGSWTTASDKNIKENFVQLDIKNILSKIKEMSITEWNYLSQDTSVRHVGPMAQDFYAAFGLGGVGNDTTIVSSDIDGINMAAIQALAFENESLKLENEIIKAKLEDLETKLSNFSSELNEIKDSLNINVKK